MSADEIVVRFNSNGEFIAFLETNIDSKLKEIRQRLRDEANELVPESFVFLYKNIPITNKQESLLSLRQCSEKNAVKGSTVFDIYLAEKVIDAVQATKSRVRSKGENKGEKSTEARDCSHLSLDSQDCKQQASSSSLLDFFTEENITSQVCWLEREKDGFGM